MDQRLADELHQEAQRLLTQPQDIYMTVAQAAALLQITPWTIRNLCRQRELPHVRIGKQIRIPRDAIRQRIEGTA